MAWWEVRIIGDIIFCFCVFVGGMGTSTLTTGLMSSESLFSYADISRLEICLLENDENETEGASISF